MDVRPTAPNGRVVILLHGKNYVAATWQGTIAVLSEAGYRVIAPDQIGFVLLGWLGEKLTDS